MNKYLLISLKEFYQKIINALVGKRKKIKYVSTEKLKLINNKHQGQRCFIIGNGPSLKNVDMSKLKNEITFSVNGIYHIPDFRPYYYLIVSKEFEMYNRKDIRKVEAKIKFFRKDHVNLDNKKDNILWYDFVLPDPKNKEVPEYFSCDPSEKLVCGGTVLFLCLQLAYYMGFTEVYLLGVDHNVPREGVHERGGRRITVDKEDDIHFHRNYIKPGQSYHFDLCAMERGYQLAKHAFESKGRHIYNCTKGSKLEVFEQVDFGSLFSSKEKKIER